MIKRRNFLKQTGAFAVGSLFLSKQSMAFFESTVAKPVGLQLFTLFNVIDDDVRGSLKKVADLGFKEIESAFSKKGGYYGLKPKEFSALLKDLGLSWQSHHVIGAPFKLPAGAKMPTMPDGKPMTLPVMKNLRDNQDTIVEEAVEAGIPYLVCASTPFGNLDELKQSIETLNKTGEACKKAGITFAYHNHDAEFRTVEGVVPYELMLKETSADTVKFELDLAWAIKGGKNPVEMFSQNPGRFPLWHVKDLDAKHETIMPVGTGTIDFKPIFAAAKTAGMKHFFVEHDMPADPFASISTSIANLKKIA
ncbi:MAG: xylose isomerase [Daejeonella sp.]|nr:xylose isomerase [Daejeonella sp.]